MLRVVFNGCAEVPSKLREVFLLGYVGLKKVFNELVNKKAFLAQLILLKTLKVVLMTYPLLTFLIIRLNHIC